MTGCDAIECDAGEPYPSRADRVAGVALFVGLPLVALALLAVGWALGWWLG